MRLTGRGIALLVSAVCLLGFGQWTGFPLLSLLGATLLGAVAAAALVLIRQPAVGIRRAVYPDRVERGRPALAQLQVANPNTSRLAGLLATDGEGGGERTIRIRPLLPGAEATYHYELPTGVRGRMTVGPLTVHRVDLFGLARNSRPAGGTVTLRVHPRQWPAHALVGGHPRHHHETTSIDDSLRGSIDLTDVREYVPGDEVRLMHWKATARTGRLMVRDLADPEQPRFTVLLDTRPDSLPGNDFEEAVDVAASLLAASARAGHHSRLAASGGTDLPTSGGPRAARSLLDELCDLGQDGERGAALVPAALTTGRTGGGCLAVVTAAAADLGSLALLRRRYGTVFVIALSADGRPPAAAGMKVLAARSAEEAIRRWNEVTT
ncbi:DUF58 domain-containing protein [Amycolatopsis antarctica]|uniref:DUF58 domain-containing protein n=1 Tax=Amycolatopsis antarctica TaxID=1854586 RepID=A0A263CYT4_9PSEU|nr:DUF58 domain-containing protein [Amycolatopsis antarctica]OZM71324.1 DUF58 domain-containing protein [Amycolatopsis antarctica]